MRRSVLVLVCLLGTCVAEAGQLPNPLRVFARDNSEHEVAFGAAGAVFEGREYAPTGRNRWRYVAPGGQCGDAPVVASGGLALTKTGLEVSWTSELRPCGGRPVRAGDGRRTFSFFRTAEDQRCTPGPRTVTVGEESVVLDEHCDGTVTLTALGTSVVLSGAPGGGRFAGAAAGAKARLDGTVDAPKRVALTVGRRRLQGRPTPPG